jgi:hypothetical protein
MGKCFKNTQNKKITLRNRKNKTTRKTNLSLQLFLTANFDHVNGPMRVWKGRRFENILKLDSDLRK